MREDVEFLDDDGDESGHDDPVRDLLATGPGRRLRWVLVLIVLVVAGGLTAAITRRGAQHPQAAPTRPAVQSSGAAPSGPVIPTFAPPPAPIVSPPAAFASSITLGRGKIQSIALASGNVVVLEPGLLARAHADAGVLDATDVFRFGLPLGDPNYAQWRLVSDGAHLWAVALGERTRVHQVDPDTLRVGPSIRLPRGHGPIVDATALDGSLYLETAHHVFGVRASNTTATAVPGLRGGGQAIAADEFGHRLLLADRRGKHTRVRAYSLTHQRVVGRARLRLPARSTQPLALEGPRLAAVGGRVWLAGSHRGSVMLLALNPRTLRVDQKRAAALGDRLAGRPTLVAGDDDLFVRSSGTGDQLWCISRIRGRVRGHWDAVPGAVAAGQIAGVLVGDGNVVGELSLPGRCAG